MKVRIEVDHPYEGEIVLQKYGWVNPLDLYDKTIMESLLINALCDENPESKGFVLEDNDFVIALKKAITNRSVEIEYAGYDTFHAELDDRDPKFCIQYRLNVQVFGEKIPVFVYCPITLTIDTLLKNGGMNG